MERLTPADSAKRTLSLRPLPMLALLSRQAAGMLWRRGWLWLWRSALVVVVLLTGECTLHPAPASPSYQLNGPTSEVARGGLTMTLRLASSPYFVGELLPAEVAISNHGEAVFPVEAVSSNALCTPAITLMASRPASPPAPPRRALTPDLSALHVGRCPRGVTQLHPGQTVTVHDLLLPLTASGATTLTAYARFLTMHTGPDYQREIVAAPNPLDGRWPSLQITVVPQAPAGRTIALQVMGTHASVQAPPPARTQLRYIFEVRCDALRGPSSTLISNYLHVGLVDWAPLPTPQLDQPGCPGKNSVWTFYVGAPGYRVAMGRVSSP